MGIKTHLDSLTRLQAMATIRKTLMTTMAELAFFRLTMAMLMFDWDSIQIMLTFVYQSVSYFAAYFDLSRK